MIRFDRQLQHQNYSLRHNIDFKHRQYLMRTIIESLRSNITLASVTNNYGELPITFIWRSFQMSFEQVQTRAEIEAGGWLENIWTIIFSLLKAGYYNSLDMPVNKCRELHAVAGTECPIDLVKFVLRLFPEQAYEVDDKWRYPLSIAVAASSLEHIIEEMSEYEHDLSLTSKAGNERVRRKENKIEMILKANPKAALAIDNKNRPPLHVALLNRKNWFEGVEKLVRTNPSVLDMKWESLYPFQLAAVGENRDLVTIFELLRASPTLVQTDTSPKKRVVGDGNSSPQFVSKWRKDFKKRKTSL